MSARKIKPVLSYISFENLTGKQKSLSEAIDELQEFSGEHLIHFASKLNLILTASNNPNGRELQDRLAEECLSKFDYYSYSVLQHEYEKQYGNKYARHHGRLIFAKLNLLFFMKVVILNHNYEGKRIINNQLDPISLNKVASLYLACSSFVDDVEEKEDNLERKKQVYNSLIRNACFYFKDDSARLMRRYYLIMFELGKIDFNEFPSMNLPKLFKENIDLDLGTFFIVGYWMWMNWKECSLNDDYRSDKLYFKWSTFKDLRFDAREKETIKSLFSATLEELKTQFLSDPKREERSFSSYLLPLQKKPLIRIHDEFNIITLPRFFYEKVSKGVFWIIDDKIKEKGRQERQTFTKYWRHLCQQYAESIFRQDILPHSIYKSNYLFCDLLYGKPELRSTDIMLFDDSKLELFLFEVTDSALNLEAQTLIENKADLKSGTFKMVIEKSRQVNRVINDIKSGYLELPGLPKERIKRYRPVLVFMSKYPVSPLTWDNVPGVWEGIETQLRRKDYLQAKHTKPLRILSIDELELLGAYQRAGSDFLNIIRKWTSSHIHSKEPLGTYLIEKESNAKFDYSRLNEAQDKIEKLMEESLNNAAKT